MEDESRHRNGIGFTRKTGDYLSIDIVVNTRLGLEKNDRLEN